MMERKKQFTIDEWFYHWFSGDDEKLRQATKLFFTILIVCDKLVLKQHTELGRKFNLLTIKTESTTPEQYAISRLIKTFLSTKEKVIWIDDVDEMTEEMEAKLPRHDVYLVKICLKSEDKILITTDVTLYENLIETQGVLGIKPIMAQDFIDGYLKQHHL